MTDCHGPHMFALLEIPSVLTGLCAIRDSTSRVGKHALLCLRFKRMSAVDAHSAHYFSMCSRGLQPRSFVKD